MSLWTLDLSSLYRAHDRPFKYHLTQVSGWADLRFAVVVRDPLIHFLSAYHEILVRSASQSVSGGREPPPIGFEFLQVTTVEDALREDRTAPVEWSD
eukprot:951391-Prorocentrum_minimum.AAC.5